VPVGDKSLKAADGYAFTLDSSYALALALSLLRAYAATDCGQRVGGGKYLVGAFKVLCDNLCNELGDAYGNRAALTAHRVGAVKAALGLFEGQFLGIAESNLFKSWLRGPRGPARA